jgi:hypothetical protein
MPAQESRISASLLTLQLPAALPPSPWSPEEALKLFNLKQGGMPWEEVYTRFPGREQGEVRRQYYENESECLERRRVEGRARDEALLKELNRVDFDRCFLTEY